MAAKCFICTPYMARITPQTCAINRAKPKADRKPGCGEDCPDWLAQRDKKAVEPVQECDRRGTCAFCGRTNMTLPQAGLCGPCAQMSKRGEIARVEGQANAWRETTAEERANPAPKPATAWDMLRKNMDCTQEDLADKIGCSRSNVSLIFRKLETGQAPTGKYYRKLLELTGYTTEQLLQPWRDKRALAESPRLGLLGQYATGGNVEVPPYAPPPAGPDGNPEESSSHGTEAEEEFLDAEESPIPPQVGAGVAPTAVQYVADLSGADLLSEPPTLMGADPAEALPTREEVDAMRRDVQALQDELLSAIPSDFALFDGRAPARPLTPPSISIEAGQRLTISSGAVRAYGLDGVRTVGLRYSAARGQLAIQPGYSGPGARKLSPRSKCGDMRSIAAAQILRAWGIKPLRGIHYPLTIGPGGLLVATIAAPARAGKEA